MKNTNKAENIILEIMETVDEIGGYYNCIKCPFHNIIESSDCPFDECPVLWELKGEQI